MSDYRYRLGPGTVNVNRFRTIADAPYAPPPVRKPKVWAVYADIVGHTDRVTLSGNPGARLACQVIFSPNPRLGWPAPANLGDLSGIRLRDTTYRVYYKVLSARSTFIQTRLYIDTFTCLVAGDGTIKHRTQCCPVCRHSVLGGKLRLEYAPQRGIYELDRKT